MLTTTFFLAWGDATAFSKTTSCSTNLCPQEADNSLNWWHVLMRWTDCNFIDLILNQQICTCSYEASCLVRSLFTPCFYWITIQELSSLIYLQVSQAGTLLTSQSITVTESAVLVYNVTISYTQTQTYTEGVQPVISQVEDHSNSSVSVQSSFTVYLMSLVCFVALIH